MYLDLSTVLEDANVVYPDLRSNGYSEREHALESGEKVDETQAHSKSPGGISVFSGTTARTSRSAQELSLLSSEDMMDAFEDLTRYSDKLLGFLIPSEISEASVTALMAQLQTKGSRANKSLTRLVTMFSVQRDRYGSDSYIPHEEILRTLLGKRHISDREIGQWRPDALLQKANLAALAFSILSRPWQNRDSHLVEELEHVFPMPFALGYVAPENMQVCYSVLQRETFELALELRTQYAITLLAHHATRPNFDSDVILQQLFYKDAHKLRGWSVLGLQSGELTEKFQEAIVSRLEAIRGAFNTFSENAFKSVELLGISFPWVSLIPRAVRWVSQRLAELESQISANGGFDGIFKALVDEIQRTNLNNSFSKGDANDDRIPQIVLDYDVPSEASNALPEPQNKRKSATSSILKLGQFK